MDYSRKAATIVGLSFLLSQPLNNNLNQSEAQSAVHERREKRQATNPFAWVKQEHESEDGKNISYNLVKIPRSALNKAIVLTDTKGISLDELTDDCYAAVNGGFFDSDYKPIGLIRSDDHQVSLDKPKIRNSAYLVINNGQPSITTNREDAKKADVAIQSFPHLIQNGRVLRVPTDPADFRSVVGLDTSGNLYLITTGNNLLFDSGATFKDLQRFLLKYNITDALALDGGSSTQMMLGQHVQTGYSRVASALCFKQSYNSLGYQK